MNAKSRGYIHSIETMGTLDGPGTRCVVFLQGCPLRCLYCHNPDTWKPQTNIETTAGEIFDRVKRYKAYFGKKGGITLSGGEPLLQPEFCKNIFQLCKNEQIKTALDTAGSILNDQVKELLKFTDLVLLDIKHSDPSEFKNLTGGSLENTLKFLDYIDNANIGFWIRQVIVPSYNDTPEQIRNLARILSNRKGLKRIELLAYHEMGIAKWKELKLD